VRIEARAYELYVERGCAKAVLLRIGLMRNGRCSADEPPISRFWANPSHKDFESGQAVSVGDLEAIVLLDIAYGEIA
jgi:hypothetical protein